MPNKLTRTKVFQTNTFGLLQYAARQVSFTQNKFFMKHFMLAITLMVFISACKKSNSTNNSCTLSTTTIVGKWKISSVTYKLTSSSASVDLLSGTTYISPATGDTLSLNACITSQVYTYLANGNYSSLSCSATTIPGTWVLSGQTLTLTQTVNGITFSTPVLITSFTCGKYTVVQTNHDTSGDQLTITYVSAT